MEKTCKYCGTQFKAKNKINTFCTPKCQKINNQKNWNKTEKKRLCSLRCWHKTRKHKIERLYRIWCGMRNRCNNPKNSAFRLYGARGIKVCENWKDYAFFKKDMSKSYEEHFNKFGKVDTTLDRIDGNGDYCKENCRWATKKQQARNRISKKDTISSISLLN